MIWGDFMKKILFLIILFFAAISFSIEVVITDVSPYSADYQLIKYLVEKRIMELDEDGKFKPNLLMTRIDLAKVIYNVIQIFNLESINDLLNQIKEINTISKLNKSLISGIDERTNILAEEQKKLNDKVSELYINFDTLEATISKIPILESGIFTLNASISSLEEQLNVENLLNLEKRITNLEKNYVIRDEFEEFKNKISNSISTINENLTQEIDDIKNDMEANNEHISVKFESLENTVNNISSSLLNVNEKLKYLDEIYLNLKDFDFEKLKNLDDLQKVKTNVENLENAVKSINEKLNNFEEFENMINSLESNLALLNTKFDSLSKSVNKLDNKYIELDTKVISLENKIGKISELEIKVEKLEKLEIDGSKLSEISRNIENFSIFIDKTSSDVENLNSEIKKLDSKIFILTLISASSLLIALISLVF